MTEPHNPAQATATPSSDSFPALNSATVTTTSMPAADVSKSKVANIVAATSNLDMSAYVDASGKPPTTVGGPSATGDIPVGTRVYVGNLSWDTRWQRLKDHMRRAGDVVHAEVFTESSGRSAGCGLVEFASVDAAANAIATLNESMLDGRNIFVRADREQGKHRFGSSRQAQGVGGSNPHFHHNHRANNMNSNSGNANSFTQNGNPLHSSGRVGRLSDRAGRYSDRGRKIVVWNLPYHIRWQDLKDLFREYGPVIRADIQQTYDGKSKGMGTVLFESEADAQRAIEEMTGKEIDGRVIDCRLDRYAQ